MPEFEADARSRFECTSVEAAGQALRRLADAARGVGFELEDARVTDAPEPKDTSSWTGYGPLDDPPAA